MKLNSIAKEINKLHKKNSLIKYFQVIFEFKTDTVKNFMVTNNTKYAIPVYPGDKDWDKYYKYYEMNIKDQLEPNTLFAILENDKLHSFYWGDREDEVE